MSSPKKPVFISCGQFLESEKALGKTAAELVTKLTPFEGYFAENQNDLRGVTESILGRLYDSVGFIAIMHHRGTVTQPDRTITRASVWIEQEIAVAAFMGQILKRPLRTLAYFQQGIPLEGVRQFILLNAKPFTTSADVIRDLEAELPAWTTALSESLTANQREAIHRKLAVSRLHALHPTLTIWVTNRTEFNISVKSVSLWHGKNGQNHKRLSRGVLSEGRKSAEIRPNSENSGISFTTDDDAMLKLQDLGVVDRHLPSYSFLSDDVDIEIRMEYEVLGEELEHRETVGVRVYGNRQLDGGGDALTSDLEGAAKSSQRGIRTVRAWGTTRQRCWSHWLMITAESQT